MFNKKRKFFTKKVEDVQASIWEYEFKIAKSEQVKEGIRLDRERAVQQLDSFKDKKENKKEIEAETENIRRYEAQMKMIDEQIYGVPANGEDPGRNGILDTIKSLTELRSMYKDYIKGL
jgi:hypothetical protein